MDYICIFFVINSGLDEITLLIAVIYNSIVDGSHC